MKRFLYFLLITMIFIDCDKDDKEIIFEIPIQNIDFEIPAGLNLINSHYFTINNISTFTSDIMDTKGIDIEDFSAILPVSADIYSLFEDIDYSFIYEISIRLCDSTDDTECIHEIFWRKPVPENIGTNLGLVSNEIDVKDILTKEKIKIQVILITLRDTSPSFFQNRLTMKFQAVK